MVQHSYLVWVNITGQIRGCVQVFFQALLLGLVLVNSNIHQADDDDEQGKRWTWSFKFNDVPLFTYWKWWTILPCPKMPRLAFQCIPCLPCSRCSQVAPSKTPETPAPTTPASGPTTPTPRSLTRQGRSPRPREFRGRSPPPPADSPQVDRVKWWGMVWRCV